MIKSFLFEKIFRRYGERLLLLISVLLLSACTAEVQLVVSADQPVRTSSVPTEEAATPAASRTPVPAPTSTNAASASRPAFRMATPDASAWGETLVDGLRTGGYVIYIQSEESDTQAQDLENCPLPSESKEDTHIDAQAIGGAFLNLGIPTDTVLHSASCGARDIAVQMFGKGESWTAVGEDQTVLRGERMAALRELLSMQPQPGTNTVLVGHGRDITDVTGHEFTEGELGIYKPLGRPGYSFVIQILPHEWAALEREIANVVRVEAFASEAIPLEQVEATSESDASALSQPGGSTALPPLTPFPTLQPDLVLPDLTTLPPTDLRIRTNPVDGHRLLRFTNLIANEGPGKMELWGETNPDSGKMTVTQYIYDTEDVPDKRVVGEFLFHPEHDHWHLGDFALYEIWSVGLEGELETVVAVSNKISYCLRDDEKSDLPDAATFQTYIVCNHERQGISVGWIDIYRYHLPGQSIDITFLVDGVYALRSTVNPENRLWETNLENNTALLYIEIEGDRVRVLESQEVFNTPPEGSVQ